MGILGNKKSISDLSAERDITGLINRLVKTRILQEINEAADALEKIGESSLEPLIANLHSVYVPETCIRIVKLFKFFGEKKAVKPLISLIENKRDCFRVIFTDDVKIEAIKALGAIKDEAAIEFLGKLSNGYLLTYREEAIELLGESKNLNASSYLIPLLKYVLGNIRFKAGTALKAIGWIPGNESEKIWFHIALKEWNQLEKSGRTASTPLIEVASLKDDPFNKEIQDAVMELFSRTGDSESKMHLEQFLAKRKKVATLFSRTETIFTIIFSIGLLIALIIMIPKMSAKEKSEIIWMALMFYLLVTGGIGARAFRRKKIEKKK